MPLAIEATLKSDDIAGAMVSLIKSALSAELSLKVVRVGAIEHLVQPTSFAALVPGVFVRPTGADYSPANLQGSRFDVVDSVRVAYAVPIRAEQDPGSTARAGLKRIIEVLAADSQLSSIINSFSDGQLVGGYPLAAEFDPEEDAFMELDVPLKVVALRWAVKWVTC